MQQSFVEIHCDDCGIIGRWLLVPCGELLPITVTSHALDQIKRSGWTLAESEPHHRCPTCSKRKSDKDEKKQRSLLA